ncbi:MAG: hypothetical protein BJ554DRAFT_6644 [Olpidium bornovanus]|uniref:Uncharacterized protein n=1 Tax=Olpidium bornovanus TaxID=278681 RepID=A0A8H8DKJ5_9FUNG|nr:MAG: hypothetical protein BJ554DRAFT_6644 [Olpidium bornovanus]
MRSADPENARRPLSPGHDRSDSPRGPAGAVEREGGGCGGRDKATVTVASPLASATVDEGDGSPDEGSSQSDRRAGASPEEGGEEEEKEEGRSCDHGDRTARCLAVGSARPPRTPVSTFPSRSAPRPHSLVFRAGPDALLRPGKRPVLYQEIELTHRRIRGLDTLGFSRFFNLERLCLRQNLISHVVGLNGLVKLKELDLYDNRISKLSGVDELGNLEYVAGRVTLTGSPETGKPVGKGALEPFATAAV